ncbi:MAG TPA: hypothetical protein VFQ61_24270 [Polyangiaceae bacterium]|nr:hypothetical protein [Polyangiaceae bacterium]
MAQSRGMGRLRAEIIREHIGVREHIGIREHIGVREEVTQCGLG